MAFSHLAYLVLVVPALQDLLTVPWLWWLGLAAPVVAAIFVLGWRARTPLVAVAVAGALLLAVVSYEAVATALRIRPFLKDDMGVAFWSVRTLLGAVVILGMAWAGHMAKAQLGKGEDAS